MKVKATQPSLFFSHALKYSHHQAAGARQHRERIHRSTVPNQCFVFHLLHSEIVMYFVCSRGEQCASERCQLPSGSHVCACSLIAPTCPFCLQRFWQPLTHRTVIVHQHWQTAVARLRKRAASRSRAVRDVFCNLKGTGHRACGLQPASLNAGGGSCF